LDHSDARREQIMLTPKRWRDRTIIRAVHDDDLEQVLRDLGLFSAVVAGEVDCAVCGNPVNLSTVGCLFSKLGEVQVTCCQEKCCAAAMATRSDA